jgi:hypothetical protein
MNLAPGTLIWRSRSARTQSRLASLYNEAIERSPG